MTTKTLKDLFEVYKPKSPDEQKFVDKHVTIKHKDRNGNDDDVFKGNTKYIKRKEERKGYDVGEDEKVYEEVEEIDELSRATLGRYAKKAQGEAEDKFDNTHRYAGRWMAGKKRWGGTGGISAARVPATNEEVELEEGMMKLSKVHIVHHHDHPAAKEFAKNYTAGMKGDHRETGPNEADEKASNAFHQRYSGVRTREGFAGSGTHVYTDHKTGAKWKVDRHPNGKTFYGTDHIISHVTGSIHEDFNLEEGEVLDTIAEDRVLRSLVAYYEELGEEVLIDDIMDIAEEMIDELSKGAVTKYANKAFDQSNSILKSRNLDLPKSVKKSAEDAKERRRKGIVSAGKRLGSDEMKKISKSSADRIVYNKEEVELDEKLTSKTPMGTYIKDFQKSDAPQFKGKSQEKRREMAIAAKLANEEVDQLDETAKIVAHLQKRYGDNIRKSHVMSAAKDFGVDSSKLAKAVRTKLGKNMLDEEQIDELSKKTLGNYAYKAATDLGQRGITAGVKVADNKSTKDDFKKMGNRQKGVAMAVKKLTKEDVISITLEKLSPVLEDVEPLTPEERLVSKLDGISESHIHLLLSLFESLNEDNQTKMLSTVETEEGIRGLIDFAIDNRGE